MLRKVLGVGQVIDSIVNRLGNIEKAFLLDDYAEGKDTGIIDLLLIGDIDNYHLHDLTRKIERYINRRIRHLMMTQAEFDAFEKKLAARPHLLIWEK